MYGIIHGALEALVDERAGPEAWPRIVARAGLEVPVTLSFHAYEDAETLALVHATAEALEVPVEGALEAFGRHWVGWASEHGYRVLLTPADDGLPGFLRRLDDLHARLSLSFPEADLPSFRVTDEAGLRCTVTYRSSRPNLYPMVRGMLVALGEHHEDPVVLEAETVHPDTLGADWRIRRTGAL